MRIPAPSPMTMREAIACFRPENVYSASCLGPLKLPSDGGRHRAPPPVGTLSSPRARLIHPGTGVLPLQSGEDDVFSAEELDQL